MAKRHGFRVTSSKVDFSGIAEVVNVVADVQKQVYDTFDEKAKRISDYRRKASQLSSKANKRLERLEKAGLTDTPAYQKWVEGGKVKFGVKGKSYNQVQAEVARLNRFLDSQTSTIRGLNNVLVSMASNTGIEYSSLTQLQQQAPKFFELSSKVEQYLRTVEDMASAIGYQKIWQQVNNYVRTQKVDLADANTNIDGMVTEIGKALKIFEEKERLNLAHIQGAQATGWYQLPKT